MLDVCLNDMVGIDYGADAPITWLGPQPLVDNGTTAYFEITEVTEVILEATNGCGSSTVSFLFTLPPLVDVVINTPPSICIGSDLVLTAAAAGITNFTWTLPSFGNINGNNLNLGMSTVAMSGNYTVEAVQGNCVVGDTAVFIVVGDAPTVVVDYPTLCAGQSANLEVTPVDNYTWDNMNTLILSNQGSSATAAPGVTTTYHLSSATGCSTSVTIEVLNSPSADITLNTLEGCGPLQVVFTDNTPDPLNFLWNFGDGTTSVLESPSHTFPAAVTGDTTYTVTLTITNGATCSESQSYYIHVLEGVTSLFDATPIVQDWPGNTVVFTNNSTGSGNLTAQWNFGNNLQSGVYNNVSSQYATWGEYTITLTVTNGFCSDQSSQVIQILPPPPVADFTAFVNVCPFESFTVYSTSQFADSTFWHWGDGSITLGTEASHSYASSGNYSLTLVVKGFNGTYDTLTHVNAVTVHPAPTADFDFFSSTIAAVVDSALINNTSLGATAYTWILGNGDTSHLAEPTPFYSLVGSYPVVLIAENQFGCHDTTSKILEVVSDGFLDFPNAFTPDGFAHPGSYDATALDNNIFHPHHRSVKEYQLAVFNKWGEMIFQTSDVHKGWDGFYNNDICPQDVYVYRAWGKFYGDVSFDKAGEIHLLFGK
jgi:gliding motility-associated-like protein